MEHTKQPRAGETYVVKVTFDLEAIDAIDGLLSDWNAGIDGAEERLAALPDLLDRLSKPLVEYVV